jgi:nucleotide-binding universal stress UspA family protein
MIRIKKILLPTDLSEYADYALPYAVELCTAFAAKLHLVHVVDSHWLTPMSTADFPGRVADQMRQIQSAAEVSMGDLKARVQGVEVETAVLLGTPHVEVIRFARDKEVDLIVLATHGRTGISHALIGSVAEKIVEMAPCPVLSTKHPEHEFVLP